MDNIAAFLKKQPKSIIFLAGITIVFIVGIIDYLLSWEVYFFVFYLFPICLVVWYAGKWPGLAISILSAGVWFISDVIFSRHNLPPVISYWNEIVILGFFLLVSLILDSYHNVLNREMESARTDFLTKIPNRRRFFEIGDLEVNRSRRYSRPLTLAYIDLDNFKSINDMSGHDTGDLLLFLMAKTIRSNIRAADTVARLGGDEFAIIFPETGKIAAQAVISKIHSSLMALMDGYQWPVTFSIGVAIFVIAPVTVDDMIRKADLLMYEVKNDGKGRIKYQAFTENNSEV